MSLRRARRAFTLLELLVVLALLAITAAAAVPAFLGDAARGPEQRVATALAEQLTVARDAARQTGVAATLVLSPTDGRYWIMTRDSESTAALPLTAGVTLAGDRTDRITIRFEPTGPASPAAITVHGVRELTVRTLAWTGEVTIDDGRAP
jgi:prepilin-type N-terminal cleavage/methylation domain-containing protein